MSDIEKFREKLEHLKAQNISNLRATSENLNSLNALNQSEEAELGSVMSIAKIDENLFSARNGELAEINHALDKIKLGTYGICEMCGEAIHKERLEVKPFARFCIKCREIFEKQSKRNK
ncbi:RNA polymerase-binding protein DksA [Helicobacter sp. 23-1044]